MDASLPMISAYARGTLVKEGVMEYTEKVNFPGNSSSFNSFSPANESELEKEASFSIFPNPACNYAIAYFNTIELNQNSVLMVYDMNGRLLRQYDVKPTETQVVLDIESLPAGVYNCLLNCNDGVLDVQRMIKY
ncbi:MAG: T9SS type A sorting domain-containing protein [Bacteroidota bacterium]